MLTNDLYELGPIFRGSVTRVDVRFVQTLGVNVLPVF